MDTRCTRPIPMESTDNSKAIRFLDLEKLRGKGQQPLESATYKNQARAQEGGKQKSHHSLLEQTT